jgi:hypothetical protein
MRLLQVAGFALLLAWAQWEELGPPAHAARLEVTTTSRMPARIYLFRNSAPFRLTPVDGVIPIRSDTYYRDALYTRAPNPSVVEVVANNEYHYLLLKGSATFYLPPGRYTLEAYRGLFYAPAVANLDLKADETRRLDVDLKPWTDPAAWISGDDHIHLTRDRKHDPVFLSWLEAEDLTVGNFLQLQRQMDAAVQYGFGRAAEARRGRYSIRSGQESRNEFWGHINLLGNDRLIRPLSTGAMYANAEDSDPWSALWFEEGRKAGAIAGFAHFPWKPQRSTLLMDAALGNLDFVEVFQFGVLKTEIWYEMLNAGLRVHPIAGSDFPVPFARFKQWPRWLPLLGPERALVRAGRSGDSFREWADGVRQGRAIVTNGPLVELDVDRASGLATAKASFWRPLEKIEIVRNGTVIAAGAGGSVTAEGAITPDSCWLAARVRAQTLPGEPDIQAHTAPVFFLRDGKPVNVRAARQSAAAQWEDNLAFFRGAGIRFSSESRKRAFFEQAERALEVLKRNP